MTYQHQKDINGCGIACLANTLITKSEKYPVGHYLLRTKNGWIDPWHNLPSIDNVQASIRKTLPTNTWYVIYPVIT